MEKRLHKATIQVADKSITFEGPRDFVESQVAFYVGLPSNSQAALSTIPIDSPVAPRSLRQLCESKKPSGHAEIVAVLAFGLGEAGSEEFTAADVRRAYIQAGIRPPKVVAQALRDAKNKQDYIDTGKKRGTYRLSPHGDRTVRFDLPRS